MPIGNRFGEVAPGTLFEREGVDRVEHAEAVAMTSPETLVDETGQGIERGLAHGVRRFQSKPAREDAESREEIALAPVEQVVTPRDRVAEGLLALGPVPCTAGQELQALGQTFGHRGWREQ